MICVKQFQKMIQTAAQDICNAEEKLTKIDLIIGDGDHGEGMKRGFSAVLSMLKKNQYSYFDDLCHDVSIELIRTMGGASGVIFGSMFLGGIGCLPHDDKVTLRMLAQYFTEGEKAIERRGKGHPGQKTMLDALYPACQAMETYVDQGGTDIHAFFEFAMNAAQEGVERSKQMQAQKGRSKGFRDATVGIPDPGAVSVSIIFTGFCHSLEN